MTTIRDRLYVNFGRESLAASLVEDFIIELGIDPDLPAEWATVDRCLTWLRERDLLCLEVYDDAGEAIDLYVGGSESHQIHTGAPTLHAALIAACQAVQKAS